MGEAPPRDASPPTLEWSTGDDDWRVIAWEMRRLNPRAGSGAQSQPSAPSDIAAPTDVTVDIDISRRPTELEWGTPDDEWRSIIREGARLAPLLHAPNPRRWAPDLGTQPEIDGTRGSPHVLPPGGEKRSMDAAQPAAGANEPSHPVSKYSVGPAVLGSDGVPASVHDGGLANIHVRGVRTAVARLTASGNGDGGITELDFFSALAPTSAAEGKTAAVGRRVRLKCPVMGGTWHGGVLLLWVVVPNNSCRLLAVPSRAADLAGFVDGARGNMGAVGVEPTGCGTHAACAACMSQPGSKSPGV